MSVTQVPAAGPSGTEVPPEGARVRHKTYNAEGTVLSATVDRWTVELDDGGGVIGASPSLFDWNGNQPPEADDDDRQPLGRYVFERDGRYAVIETRNRTSVECDISDFTFTVVSRILVDGSDSQLVIKVATADGREFDLPAPILSNVAKFKQWCSARDLLWTGSQAMLDGLFNVLKSAEAPEKVGVTVTGLHLRTWVLPDETFGEHADELAWVAPGTAWHPSYGLGYRWSGTDRARAVTPDHAFSAVARLHRPDVITPILGWMAAAPLRSLFRNFPILAVTGPSGFGKTTLAGIVLEAFGYLRSGGNAFNLAGSTPYGITGMGASTNAFPAWFDEYRGGLRPDTRSRFEQLLRDAWDGSASVRGGQRENASALTAMEAAAPIIVTGEEALFETSHLERSVIVNIPKDGRNPDALAFLQTPTSDLTGLPPRAVLQGFGRAYLEWLLTQLETGLSLPWKADRREHGLAVIRWGYELLAEFWLELTDSVQLPPFDDSRVRRDGDEAAATSPIAELIEDAIGATERYGTADERPIAWDDADGFRWLRPGALSKWAQDHRSTMTLPGGQQTISTWVQEEYGAVWKTHPTYRRALRWKLGK